MVWAALEVDDAASFEHVVRQLSPPADFDVALRAAMAAVEDTVSRSSDLKHWSDHLVQLFKVHNCKDQTWTSALTCPAATLKISRMANRTTKNRCLPLDDSCARFQASSV